MIFRRIMLPLNKPALATCALFQFVHTRNDFFGPLLYINDPLRYTLAYGSSSSCPAMAASGRS